MTKTVDPHRFIPLGTRTLVKAWIKREPKREIPWTPLRKPLSQCTVAMVTTAAIALLDDRPFDQEGERRDPWWGDPTYRVIPRDATEADLRFDHLHVDNRPMQQDVDCAFPLRRLAELETSGEIGRSAPSHYSYMGYQVVPDELLSTSVPAMIEGMRAEEVDVVLLAPY